MAVIKTIYITSFYIINKYLSALTFKNIFIVEKLGFFNWLKLETFEIDIFFFRV
jgi:hypothetical protein